jgi:protein gp37
MANNSAIEWTDTTWNPVVGCTKVSPGCAHCYAETMAKRIKAMALADIAAGKDPGRKRHYIEAIDDKGRWSGKLIPVPEALDDPLGWKKPRRVLVNSMSDLFHESVPDEFIANVFATMYESQWHTFQVLTKRADRLRLLANPRMPHAMATLLWDRIRQRDAVKAEYVTVGDIERDICAMWPLPNVWLGVSCERQQEADERIPWLLKTPAAVRFVSAEPLLGPIDFMGMLAFSDGLGSEPGVDWVIVGGESGPGARPCNVEWIRQIVAQCSIANKRVRTNAKCFVKQLGAKPEDRCDHRYWPRPKGGTCNDNSCRAIVLKDRHGADMDEWPADLRVRKFPEVAISPRKHPTLRHKRD